MCFQTPCTPGSFNRDFSHVLESQERELENRRTSMMTMEILLNELNAERAAKNEEIQRLKVSLSSSSFFLHKMDKMDSIKWVLRLTAKVQFLAHPDWNQITLLESNSYKLHFCQTNLDHPKDTVSNGKDLSQCEQFQTSRSDLTVPRQSS